MFLKKLPKSKKKEYTSLNWLLKKLQSEKGWNKDQNYVKKGKVRLS
jgi:hypothetical protein